MLPSNDSCVFCLDSGYFKFEQTCVKCADNCNVCANESACSECYEGYFISKDLKCSSIKYLLATLNSTSNSSALRLNFNDSWSDFFSKIDEYVHIKINGISENFYSYLISQANETSLDISFDFKTNISSGSLLNLDINYSNNLNNEFILLKKNLSIALQIYCVPPSVSDLSKIFFFIH